MSKFATWGDITRLEYGRAFRGHGASTGSVRVYGTNGPIGYSHDSMSKGPGVIIGRKGAYRGVHYSIGDFWVIDTAFYLSPTVPMNMRWAYYALLCADINGLGSGSAVPSTRREDFYSLSVRFPEPAEQRAIAEVLGALDDKIAANAAAATLSFDLAEAEFGAIWAAAPVVVPLGDVAALEYGRALPAVDRVPGPIPVYGSGGESGWHDKAFVDGPAVIVGRKGTVGATYWSPRDCCPIDTTFYLVPTSKRVQLAYLFFAVRQMKLGQDSSDSAVPGVNRNFAYSRTVRVPDETSSRSVESRLRVLLGVRDQLHAESSALATLRDTLLPQLMSGKLRVKDAEQQVEAVV